MNESEFEPLLPAGIHDITKEALVTDFVSPFLIQDKRKFLVERFESLLEKIESLGIPCEIWIDGSFVTKKEEPNDIDMVFFCSQNDVNSLTSDKVSLLREILDNSTSKYRYNCDVYFAPNDDTGLRSYWRGWFGFTRSESAKGFIRINI